MNAKPELLFLAHRIPYPPEKGDKIRSYNMLRHLAGRFRVHLGCFADDPDDLRHRGTLAAMTESVLIAPLSPRTARIKSARALLGRDPLSVAYYSDARMRRFVASARSRALAGEVAFSSQMAPYVLNGDTANPVVVDLCDADSEKWRQYAANAGGPMRWVYAREASTLADLETRIINTAGATLAISDDEAALLASRDGVRRQVLTFGNGVDAAFFSPEAAIGDAPGAEVLFVGAMDYRANIDAVMWFATKVWPQIAAVRPSATFAIVGSRPAPEVMNLASVANVTVTGRVADVRPWLAHAGAVVAPLRIARGVQNKVLEAMAMARPVVATTGANTGIGARDGAEIVLADMPQAFAGAVLRLLDDRPAGDAIGAAARRRILSDFSWAACLGELDRALEVAGIRIHTSSDPSRGESSIAAQAASG